MDNTADGRYLTRRDLKEVIRRAAELEAESGGATAELSEIDVLRIGGEVGLSEGAVRRALAEYQAGSGGGALLSERGWLSRVCGSDLITSSRDIRRPAEEVRQEVEAHFLANESLRLVRRTRAGSLWEPDKGVVASLIRGLDLFGRGYQLAKKTRAVELRVIPVDETACRVSLTSDLGNGRAGWFWGMGIAGGGAAAAAVGVLALALPAAPDAVATGAPLVLGLGIVAARAGYQRAVEKMRLVLDGLLDRLEHEEPLAEARSTWRDLLK